MTLRFSILISSLLLSACVARVGDHVSPISSELGGGAISVSVVPESLIPAASSIDGTNPFWSQMNGIFGNAFGVKLEDNASGEVAYVHNPFRTESKASIFYIRVPYASAHEYLGDRYDDEGNELFPELLKVVDLNTGTEWAAASLWFMDYQKTDLGVHGNGADGQYQEMVLSFVGTRPNSPNTVIDLGPMSTAALALSRRYQLISARLVLNNQTAVDLGVEFMGFDKTLGEVTITDDHVSVTAEGRSIITNLELPNPGTFANTKAQGELALRVVQYDGWDAGQAMLGKTASRAFLEELEKGALPFLKPAIRDWRDGIAADQTHGGSTLAAFDHPHMPRGIPTGVDFHVTSSRSEILPKGYLQGVIDPTDPLFGIVAEAEVDGFFRAPFMRIAFGVTPEGRAHIEELLP